MVIDLDEAARRLNERPVVERRAPDEVLALGRRYRQRRTIGVVASGVVAVVLIGAVAAVGVRSSSRHPTVTIVATTPTVRATPVTQPPTNQNAAIRVAGEALDAVVVPADSTRWTAPVPSVIAQPGETLEVQPSLARHRIWTVPMSSDAVIDFLHAHHPTGGIPFLVAGTSTSSRHGAVLERDLEFSASYDGPAIAEVVLDISVADRGPGSAWLRARCDGRIPIRAT